MIFAVKVLAALVCFALIVQFGAEVLQRKLLYFPDTRRTTPAEVGLSDVVERAIATAPGQEVLVWQGQARAGFPTILYFHGNAGSFANRYERIRKYLAEGYGVVMMTYRGFGGSTGTPSEAANVADAKAVYEWLRGENIPAGQIVLYGESLGTGVAMQVAAEKSVGAVILDAPYTSIVDLATLHYPWLPVRLLMTDRYESSPLAKRITVPVLIVHGTEDTIIPVAMGKELAAAIHGPVQLALIEGAGHSDHYLFGSYDVIFRWLARFRPAAAAQ